MKKGWTERGWKIIGIGHSGKQWKHRMVMENHLGRKLSYDEVVHHKNGDRKDNRIENLEVMTRGKHSQLHAPKRNKLTGRFE